MNVISQHWRNLLLLLPFTALSLLALIYHEPWRDELQDFYVTMDARTLGDLFRYMYNCSAQGPIMFIVPWLLSFFTQDFMIAAILSWGYIFTAVALLVFFSPYAWFEKLLISLGYMLLYDYSIIAGRPYGITVACVFTFLALFARRESHPWPAWLMAGVTALSSFFGVIFGVYLSALLAADFLRRRQSLRCMWAALPLLGLGIFLALPHGSDSKATAGSFNLPEPAMCFMIVKGVLNRIFITIPNAQMIWFPHVSVQVPAYPLWLALAVLALVVIVAPRRLLPAAFFWIISATLMTLFILRGGSGIRHHGFLIIVLLVAVWLERLYADEKPLFAIPWLHNAKTIQAAFLVLLAAQVWSGLLAVHIEVQHPFSDNREAGRALNRMIGNSNPQQTLVATFLNSGPISVLIYYVKNKQQQFYSLELMKPYRFIASDDAWMKVRPDNPANVYTYKDLVERFTRAVNSGPYSHVFLVTSGIRVPPDLPGGYRLRLVYATARTDLMTSDERFCIYQLVAPPAPGAEVGKVQP